MHNKICHLIYLPVSRPEEDEQIKKHTAFMGWLNLSTRGQLSPPLSGGEIFNQVKSWALAGRLGSHTQGQGHDYL